MCTSDVLLFSGFRHELLHLCRRQYPYSQHGLGPSSGSAPRIRFLRRHSQLPGTVWLKTEIDSLTAPEARSSKSRYGQGRVPSRCSRTEPPPASYGYRHCLACGRLAPPLSPWSHCFLLSQTLSVPVSFKAILHVGPIQIIQGKLFFLKIIDLISYFVI